MQAHTVARVLVTAYQELRDILVNLFAVASLRQLCGGGYLASLETRGCHLLIPTSDINMNGRFIGKTWVPRAFSLQSLDLYQVVYDYFLFMYMAVCECVWVCEGA